MAWFETLPPELRIAVIAIVAPCLLIAAGVIAHAWRRARESEHRAQSLRLLVERGLPPHEIARILLAGNLAAMSDEDRAEIDAEEDPEAFIVRCLSDNGYDGDDIQQVLAAARSEGRIGLSQTRIVRSMADNDAATKDIAAVLRGLGRGGAVGVQRTA